MSKGYSDSITQVTTTTKPTLQVPTKNNKTIYFRLGVPCEEHNSLFLFLLVLCSNILEAQKNLLMPINNQSNEI